MKSRVVSDIKLYYDAGEEQVAEKVEAACIASLPVIKQLLGLAPPRNCRVYVATSWLRFVLHSAPWLWRALYAITLPLWYPRAAKMWRIAGGWNLLQRNGPAVAIKPPRLLEHADRSMGERIFVQVEDANTKLGHTVCHELTHAFTAHLRLPMWLNEGLAMLAVDRLAGGVTVREDTLALLARSGADTSPTRYQDTARVSADMLVYQASRGYWLTRFLEETYPQLLRDLLVQRLDEARLTATVATAMGIPAVNFWDQVDERISAYFGVDHS